MFEIRAAGAWLKTHTKARKFCGNYISAAKKLDNENQAPTRTSCLRSRSEGFGLATITAQTGLALPVRTAHLAINKLLVASICVK